MEITTEKRKAIAKHFRRSLNATKLNATKLNTNNKQQDQWTRMKNQFLPK